MRVTSDIDDDYLRRVHLAGVRRATRSLLRALGAFLIATGMVSLALVALGWAAA